MLSIEYLGHSAFLLRSEEGRFVTDPFDEIGYEMPKVKAQFVTVSHGHYDHSGGLAAFARLNPSAAIYVQRRAGGGHYGYDGPGNGYRYIGIDKSLLELPQVRLLDGDMRIDDELSLFVAEEIGAHV